MPHYVSRDVRKPDFCICENKDADQLCGNCEADQRLCFRYTDSTIPLLPNTKFQASSHFLRRHQPDLCGTLVRNPDRFSDVAAHVVSSGSVLCANRTLGS